MSHLRLLARQVRYENLAFWRNPASAFFTFAFPLVFMAIVDLVFASAAAGPGATLDFYTPSVITFAMVNAGFTTLAMSVAIARDEGILKRVRGTPLPTWLYLMARVVHSMLIGLLLAAIVMGTGALVFGVAPPVGSLPAVLGLLALGGATFCALGLAVAGLVPSASGAPAVVNAIVLPLLFVSNVFLRVEDGILATVGGLFPVRHFADALQALYHPVTMGPLDPADLGWLAAWGLAGLLLALRTFTWEPKA